MPNPIILLFLSILCLFIGPFVSYALSSVKATKTLKILNIFAITLVVAMLGFHVFPELYETIGIWSIALISLGFCLPLGIEKMMTLMVRRIHLVTLVLALSGWGAHAVIDGAVLSVSGLGHSHHHHEALLPLLVILHRIPVGQVVWLLIRPQLGIAFVGLILSVLIAGTLLGYFVVGHQLDMLHSNGYAIFQSLVVGSLLHVVLFIKHSHSNDSHSH